MCSVKSSSLESCDPAFDTEPNADRREQRASQEEEQHKQSLGENKSCRYGRAAERLDSEVRLCVL